VRLPLDRADCLATPESIIVAVVLADDADKAPLLVEIKRKTDSNIQGATILFRLGVNLEDPSPAGSITSIESNQQVKVYAVL
jgi:hypothetical protein